jgi:arsenite methyltransferase
MTDAIDQEQVRERVRTRYAVAASGGGCCEGDCGTDADMTGGLYGAEELGAVPDAAALASLGCGNPTAVAELRSGETVLDLGSGGGIDVLLSARRVGPEGFAYGLDMTTEMLELARRNAAEAGATNVEFLQGYIEDIPLPDESVDVIISNCVINLSADKDQVLREAFRVLKPGGRMAVSDVVVRGDDIPAVVGKSMELWIGCIAGALEEGEYRAKLTAAGFDAVDLEPTRIYRAADATAFLATAGIGEDVAAQVDGRFMSAFVRATKPAGTACCGPTCCP